MDMLTDGRGPRKASDGCRRVELRHAFDKLLMIVTIHNNNNDNIASNSEVNSCEEYECSI